MLRIVVAFVIMTLEQIRKHFGSYAEAARKIGITRGGIAQWKTFGFVPRFRQLQVEKLTGGKLQADKSMYLPK